MIYNTTGMYKDTIPNVAGCDSVITLDLTINTTVRDTNAVTACDSYVWASNGMQYTTSGIYSDTLQAVNGCDSISTIDLTINLSTSSTFSMASCDSYLWPQNGMTYNTTGMYKDTIPNVAGCDSVITLDLTIDTVDTRVVRVGFDLQAQNTNLNATYQWIDCHTNTAIVGATSSTFTVVTNGSYQLEVNQSNCTDTSDCITIMNVGIEINNRKNLDFRLFPNPTKKWVNIEISELNKKDKICIYNIQGRLIKIILPLSNLSKINLYDFASGIYFVRYRNETRKMIVND
ncbi:MAG: T9SS C-terminal target domain-containing protein [Bacteroidetes bacterium]|nr:MAG: T9SS C-terminal target domain-containing protein [Bacteroidota bacterium]